jgi:hypothetical protein
VEAQQTERLIIQLPRGKDGLFTEPSLGRTNDEKAKQEMEERLNRMMFAEVFKYADDITGNTATFHEEGDYNCGDCNKQYKADSCTGISGFAIDPEAGSCENFEIRRACDRELVLIGAATAEDWAYGVAKNGKGFGCHRCPFQHKADEADSHGRELWCGKGAFRVPWNACCALNGAELVSEYEGNTPVKKDDDMPAKSKAQQEAMAIAEHSPDKLYGKNKGLLKMSQGQLHDFAATPRKGLPSYAGKKKGTKFSI